MEPNDPIKGCVFNDNDSIILIAQGRKIISIRADNFEYIREFSTNYEIEGLDTWHGYIYVGQQTCFEILK